MVQKQKICLLGATGVGKTSLVARFVHSVFSDVYRTTVGVTIDKARVSRGNVDVDLLIWDLSGEDDFQSVELSYLRGAAGYLLVVDGTRPDTANAAISLQRSADRTIGPTPLVLVVNKADLAGAHELARDLSGRFEASRWPIEQTSAKTGDGVERAFATLVDAILARPDTTHA